MDLLLSLPMDSIQTEPSSHYLRRNLDTSTNTNIPIPVIELIATFGISLLGVSCCFACCYCIIQDAAEQFAHNIN